MDKIGRIYKGEDFDLEIKVPISGDVFVDDLRLYTDCNISFRPQNITVSGNTIKVHCEDHDLDLLNDGVLKYYLKYQNYVEYIKGGDVDERIEDIINTNTMHYLKTREGYDAITPEDIYNWGKQAQKDAMTEITITQNGTYTREDGYSSVIVNVEGGGSCNMQRKNYNITSNGTTTITPDAGYDGITGGTITVDVPQTGHTDAELEAAYTSGYTGGEIAGIAEQKALLTSITATTNNTYSTENGYGTVVVNVPQNLRPEYKLAGVCMYYVRSTVYAETTVTFSIPQGVIAMYLNDDTPIDISSGRYTYSNTGSTDYTLVLTIYTSTIIDSDIIRYLHNKTITSMTFYGNVMWGQCPNETIKPSWASTILDITTGMCKSNHLIMTQRCGFSNVERINFDVPLAWVYDYTSMAFPQCSSIYLTANTTYAPAYKGSYSTVKFNLQNTGTLYCKQSIYDNLVASEFWSHFPTGWTISPTL